MKLTKTALWTSAGLIGLALIVAAPAAADQVILDDLIVDGSACIGFDCVNGESFGFDTIRIKENNLRIKAQDTSTSASFPTNDWQITFNDSSNGGANKFSIDDIDGGRTPFTIEAGAPSNSLFVENSGELGLGTNNPVVNLHVVDGNTPTLRLEQDGSSGFTPQTWDVAGNEANFFIRDATSGSTLPFRIFPGAPSNALTIEGSTGDLGIGTTSPTEDVHIRNSSGAQPTLLVEDATATAGNQIMLHLVDNNGSPILRYEGSIRTWDMTAGNFFSLNDSTANTEFSLNSAGDLTLEGDVITSNCPAGCGPADFVFEPDYELMPLSELEAFVEREKHLPNIPSAEEMSEGVKVTWMQMRLLEKIEELALYTIQQADEIGELRSRLSELEQVQE